MPAMPYLRMFLGERQIDETFISEVLLNSVLSLHILDEEKQEMLLRHADEILSTGMQPAFCVDSIPSVVNNFNFFNEKKDS
jgi:hypothetical protein